jgi:DNA-binding response OmpR family regulator
MNAKNIPVIMVTAVGYDLNKQLSLNMGAVDYIIKPVDIKELRTKVARYLGKEPSPKKASPKTASG